MSDSALSLTPTPLSSVKVHDTSRPLALNRILWLSFMATLLLSRSHRYPQLSYHLTRNPKYFTIVLLPLLHLSSSIEFKVRPLGLKRSAFCT